MSAPVATVGASRPRGPRVCLLGSPRLLRADGAVHLLERKDAALLAMLALEGPTLRAKAAALLWPDAEEEQARGNLRQRLFRLRRAAEREVVEAATLLRLVDDVTLDLTELQQQLAADASAGQGELLASHDYSDHSELGQWVQTARERWRGTRLHLLAQVASDLESKRQIAAALPYAQRMLADDPLLEHAHRRLMRLHYLRGDRAAALAAYERCREVLGRELGLRPSAETVQLARLIEASGALPQPAPAPSPMTVLRPPRLIGRNAAWQQLDAALPLHGVALIVGEPGIGKSRLIADYCAAHGDAALVGARPGDSRLPHALLARLVRACISSYGVPAHDWVVAELARLAPELGPAPASRLEALRLQQAVGAALVQWQAGGLRLLALDDLQFADEATLDMLPALTAAARQLGLRSAFASRAHELPPAVAAWMSTGQAGATLTLGALDRLAVQELLASLAIAGLDPAAWAPTLANRTGGNPMFLLEVLIALLDAGDQAFAAGPREMPAPAHIEQMIKQRLGQLSAPALKLARVAAIAGQDFSAEMAADVLGRDALDIIDDWQALQAAQIIRDGAFAHDLIHEATLRSVPPALAEVVHRQVARFLELHEGPPARIAQHWQAGRQWARAAEQFLQAAAVAFRAAERRLEAELAAQAAECCVAAGDREREFAAREQQFHAALHVDRFEVQTERAQALLALAASPAQRAAALEAQATILVQDYQDDVLVTVAREAREIAHAIDDPLREMSAASYEARALSRCNRPAEALLLVQRHVDAAYAREHDTAGARVLGDFGCALIACDRTHEAVPLFERAMQVAMALHDLALCQYLHMHISWAEIYQGDLPAATSSFERARAMSARLGSERKPAGIVDAILGRFYKELGRFGEALDILDQTLAELRESRSFVLMPICAAELADVYLWLGQPARAIAAFGTLDPSAPAPVRRAQLVQLARIRRQQGVEVIAELQQALELAAREGGAIYRLFVELELAQALPAAEGAALALDAAARSGQIGLRQLEWPLRAAACDALRRAGRLDEAAGLAERLSARFADWPPTVLYAPLCWSAASQAFEAVGDTGAADAALRRAADWIRTTLPAVPSAFQDSFMHRNPINRAILASASRLPA